MTLWLRKVYETKKRCFLKKKSSYYNGFCSRTPQLRYLGASFTFFLIRSRPLAELLIKLYTKLNVKNKVMFLLLQCPMP